MGWALTTAPAVGMTWYDTMFWCSDWLEFCISTIWNTDIVHGAEENMVKIFMLSAYEA